MGELAQCPPEQLFGDFRFDGYGLWTLTGDALITGGLLKLGSVVGYGGAAFQNITTQTGEVYKFQYEITYRNGDPGEGVRMEFGTAPNIVYGPLSLATGIYTVLLADPDGTGRAGIKQGPGFDLNEMHISYFTCVRYANYVACDLNIIDSENTFCNSWALGSDKYMVQLVNEKNSTNQYLIIQE